MQRFAFCFLISLLLLVSNASAQKLSEEIEKQYDNVQFIGLKKENATHLWRGYKDRLVYIFDEKGKIIWRGKALKLIESTVVKHCPSTTNAPKFLWQGISLKGTWELLEPMKFSSVFETELMNDYQLAIYYSSLNWAFVYKNGYYSLQDLTNKKELIQVQNRSFLDIKYVADNLLLVGSRLMSKSGKLLTANNYWRDESSLMDSEKYCTLVSENKVFIWDKKTFKFLPVQGELIGGKSGIYKNGDLKYLYKKEANKWGIWNLNKGKYIVEPQYDFLDIRKEDGENTLLTVQKNGKFGLISIQGKEILPLQFSRIINIGARVLGLKGSTFDLYDFEGNQWNTEPFTNVGKISKSSLSQLIKMLPYYYHQNKDQYQASYQEAKRVLYAGGGIIQYKTIQDSKGNYYYQTEIGAKKGILDQYGTEVIPTIYDYLSFIKGGANRSNYLFVKKNNKWGLLGIGGEEQIAVEYDSLYISEYSIMGLKNGKLAKVNLPKMDLERIFFNLTKITLEDGNVFAQSFLLKKEGEVFKLKPRYPNWGIGRVVYTNESIAKITAKINEFEALSFTEMYKVNEIQDRSLAFIHYSKLGLYTKFELEVYKVRLKDKWSTIVLQKEKDPLYTPAKKTSKYSYAFFLQKLQLNNVIEPIAEYVYVHKLIIDALIVEKWGVQQYEWKNGQQHEMPTKIPHFFEINQLDSLLSLPKRLNKNRTNTNIKPLLVSDYEQVLPLYCKMGSESGEDCANWQMEAPYYWVQKNRKWGMVNQENKLVIPIVYEKIYDIGIENNLLIVAFKNGKWQLWDKEGKEVLKNQYQFIFRSDNTIYLSRKGAVELLDMVNGNKVTTFATDTIYDIPMSVSSNCMLTRKNGVYWIYNKNGELLVPEPFQYIDDHFINIYGLPQYKLNDNKAKKTYAGTFYNITIVKQNNKWNLLDLEEGKLLLSEGYDSICYRMNDRFVRNKIKRDDNYYWFFVQKNGKWGVFDGEKIVLPIIYDDIKFKTYPFLGVPPKGIGYFLWAWKVTKDNETYYVDITGKKWNFLD